MVDPTGFLKVTDFGIARLAGLGIRWGRRTHQGRRRGGDTAIHGARAVVGRSGL